MLLSKRKVSGRMIMAEETQKNGVGNNCDTVLLKNSILEIPGFFNPHIQILR
jgi:hypothetical protein